MHYYPILKAKQGEIQALKELKTTTKASTFPILQIPPPNMSRPERGEEAVIIPHDSKSITTCIRRIKSLSGIHCFLDPTPARLSKALIHNAVRAMAALPNPPAPVIELQGSDSYLAAYRADIGEPETYCLRLPNEASIDANIVSTIQRALRHYGLSVENGFLLLDVADVSTTAANIIVYGHDAIKMFQRTARLPFIEQVLASGAFPITFPQTAPSWVPLPYPRRDMELWRMVNAQIGVSYGDYAVSNPNNEPMPSYSGSPKARYTARTDFVVVKGVKVDARPFTMSEQYHRISKIVKATTVYSGPGFSWGDGRIDGCCDPTSTSNGNLTTWVAINTNHHIEFVTAQLRPARSLSASSSGS